MLTRIEIDGFKTFDSFALDLEPFSAIVGPNASGKSNLFDAIRFLSLLAQYDVRTAMQDLRGEAVELFRRTGEGLRESMRFAVEAVLDRSGIDGFGTSFELKAQRVRYEVGLDLRLDRRGQPRAIYVSHETCYALAKTNDRSRFARSARLKYQGQSNPYLRIEETGSHSSAFVLRQDGSTAAGSPRRGRPVTIPAVEASRTALSTITTAEFPHLYALRDMFVSTRFLEINPQAARRPNDRFEERRLKSDASNLSAVLARLEEDDEVNDGAGGSITDISLDLASLINSVRSVTVRNDPGTKEYSFGISTTDGLDFSSRVISDGTLRLLALLAVLDDPERRGILCFEEPENGVHEGRIQALISLLRDSVSTSASLDDEATFQILVNTHSPAVMASLRDEELVAADSVSVINPERKTSSSRTRMRTTAGGQTVENPERELTRAEINEILRQPGTEA